MENLVWLKEDNSSSSMTNEKPRKFTIGITPILASVAGKFSQIKLKPIGSAIEKGKSFGSVESPTFFGVTRSPFSGKIIQVNENLNDNPKLANDFPYQDGWLARIESTGNDMQELNKLKRVEDSQDEIKSIMEKLHVRCFAAFPDHQMFEIGVECAATLTKLGELISKIPQGEVVHLVSDDLSADFEMIRWSEETGQKLLETRREGNLFHFVVKKVK